MVPDLIWATDFFGPQAIWSPSNLVPEKFGPLEIWSPRNLGLCMKMPYNDFNAKTKYLGNQISLGPNFLGPKFLEDQKSKGPK